MKIRKFISTTIREYLNESNSYSFNLSIKEKSDNGFTYKIFYYDFKIEDIEYECVIYPNAFKIRSDDFDVGFITKGGTTDDIVGKDLNFMNSVLKTVAECIIDFINKNDIVKKIRFQTQGIREKVYVRFFKSHPYFYKYEIDDSYEYSGFVEIYINKGIDI
jgi:hypothetical protein